ncbi:hypothetical protein EC991_011371 [Linnemannia zychae]|nr:hypothetical protein EC991_011371 [Linnemannia zychae]
MGIVDLDCIAANPNSTALYAIANVETSGGDEEAVVLRSNDNPANVTDIQWEPTIYVPSGKGPNLHYRFPRFGNVDCAVSSSGQFTAFFYNPVFSVTGSHRLVPMGVQVQQGGRSLLVWGSMMYGWTSPHFVHQSFYIENDGVETAVHAVMDETASVIRFGLIDQSTGHLKLAAIWKLADGNFMLGQLTDKIPKLPNPKTKTFVQDYDPAPPFNTDQRHMLYSNGSLYMYSDTTGLISSFPFLSPLNTAPIQKPFYQASPIAATERHMFFQGSRQNSSYFASLTKLPMEQTLLASEMKMQLSTVDYINPTPNTSTIVGTNSSSSPMLKHWFNKDVSMFQAVGGHLPGQEPFAVGLTTKGYFGLTLGGQSMGNIIPAENDYSSRIEGAFVRGYRSRFRNHNDQVVPGYKTPKSLDPEIQAAAILGGIFGFFVLVSILRRFNSWLTESRLASERRHAERNSYELIARLQHVSVSQGRGGGVSGAQPTSASPPPSDLFATEQASAHSSAHTLLDDLRLTRHPRPTTVITITDDNESDPTPVDRNTPAL